jgi:LPS-assembly protein
LRYPAKQLFSLILILASTVVAAEDWHMCAVPALTRAQASQPRPTTTDISADWLQALDRNLIEFNGNVQVLRDQQRIHAEHLTLSDNPRHMYASGQARFTDGVLSLSAGDMAFDNEQDHALFNNAEFTLYELHLRGSASRIEQLDAQQREFLDVRYTTCDPGRNDWSLAASRLELDDQAGMGTAHHSVLRLGPVPVFYFPWFRFPITDERMSGFLPPLVSSSTIGGNQFSVPFYWNLADNYDMTIMPISYSKRGLQLNTENRYLFDSTAGELRLSRLQDDVTESDRWFRYWQHHSEFDYGISATLLLQRVSDTAFMDDFGHLDNTQDVDHLQSMLRINARPWDWNATLTYDEHQNLIPDATPTSDQYKRLPQLTLNRNFETDEGQTWLRWNNEYVSYDHEVRTKGRRLRLRPTLTYPVEGDYYFVTPSLTLDLTRYSIDDNPAGADEITRQLPLWSVDSGLFFERMLGDGGRWLQTLEPRLFLLYVPYRDQSEIPLFDTSLLTESFNQLFNDNRFAGGDRIGDSRQISLALSSRFIDQDAGREVFDIGVGQAFYREERQVNLGRRVDDPRDRSGIITRIGIRPDRLWKIDLSRIYNQSSDEADQNSASVRYINGGKVFDLEYHLRRGELEQSTVALVYPLSPVWNVFMKRQHSILHDMPVQYLGGFSYESCCWRFDVLYEKKSDTDFTDIERSLFFQLTFKGLGSAGKDIDTMLKDGILGYSPSR